MSEAAHPGPPEAARGPRPAQLSDPATAPLWQAIGALEDLADPAALTRVRREHPGADPDLVAAIATQVDLRRRAAPRLGPWASTALWDPEAVQQATRADVARYRARALAERWGGGTVADIGSSVGADAHALAQAGFTVVAIERDPWRAEAARINLASDDVTVVCGDVLTLGTDILAACDAVYVDPARRPHAGPLRADGRRSRPVSDPQQWSPPWSWVVELSQTTPVVAKVAPGMDSRLIPPGADVEWVDHHGETVEATVWMGPGTRGERRATSIAADAVDSLARTANSQDGGCTVTVVQRLLIEPSPGVVRAGLVGALAERLDAGRLQDSTWLTAEGFSPTPLARAWQVIAEVPHTPRDLRAWLRGRGRVTWKTADTAASAKDWERRVGHRPAGAADVTIVITGAGRAFAVARPDG